MTKKYLLFEETYGVLLSIDSKDLPNGETQTYMVFDSNPEHKAKFKNRIISIPYFDSIEDMEEICCDYGVSNYSAIECSDNHILTISKEHPWLLERLSEYIYVENKVPI